MAEKQFKMSVLSNGMQVLGEVMPASKSAALGFFVNTGSRDEVSSEAGVSHFLEHMMFKGTATRSTMDVTYELGNLAVQANAYTNNERTVYYGAVLPEYFSRFQELLSDMLRPALDPIEFETEKKVILEEIGMYQDKPHFYFFENAIRDYFSGHGLGNSVLGSTESVSAISREQMRDYFNRRYIPNNIVLVASGNFEWDRFLENAEKYCGHWKANDAERVYHKHENQRIEKRYERKNISQSHVLLMTNGPSAQEDERYPATILSMILGDSSGSRLYWELVDSGLAESAGMDIDENDGLGIYYASASCEPNKLAEVSDKLTRTVSNWKDISQEEVERAKNKLAARVVLGGELPMSRLMAIGPEWLYNKKYVALSKVVDRIRGVTLAEILATAEKYPISSWSTFYLTPSPTIS